MSRVVLGPALVILALAVAACSDNGDSDPTPAPDPSPAATAAAADAGDARTAVAIVPDPVEPVVIPEPEPEPEAPIVEPDEAGTETPDGVDAESDGPMVLDDLLGEDGRLSVLLLGTDYRKGIKGERTDAIIVATINPADGKVAMVSMPRDTVNVPIGPDRVYGDRINTLYQSMKGGADKPRMALKKTRKAFEYAFDTEIDYYALVDFRGLVRLIDDIGGIDITLEEKLHDPTMHLTKKGLKLKAGDSHLDGKTTLAFSRTRHTDSDYDRSRRQHQVLASTIDAVRDNGAAALPSLIELARKKVVTDLPIAEAAPLLLELAADARLSAPKSVVLAPGKFAREGPSTFTITPKVPVVRKMFSRAFKPVD